MHEEVAAIQADISHADDTMCGEGALSSRTCTSPIGSTCLLDINIVYNGPSLDSSAYTPCACSCGGKQFASLLHTLEVLQMAFADDADAEGYQEHLQQHGGLG